MIEIIRPFFPYILLISFLLAFWEWNPFGMIDKNE